MTYRVKDAIADRFMEREGHRPSVKVTNPDLRINVHVSNTDVTVSLDSSGEPLFKRGYRVGQTEAPINEVLAAGILLMAGWDGQCDFIDPMCGSGTFLIEAALIARNIAPGIYRQSFAFEKWRDYDQELFQGLYDDDSAERDFAYTIYGSDILKQAIAIADENVKGAGAEVAECIKTKVCPIEELDLPSKNALVVTNPPYGERLKVDDLSALYDRIGTKLKNDFTGMSVWMVSEPNEANKSIGLAPSEKIKLDNGGIGVELRKYEMFEGRREDFVRRRAANKKDENESEENLGFTFHKYEYDDPVRFGADEEEEERGKDRRKARFSFANGGKDDKPQEDKFEFDSAEDRENYELLSRRHQRFSNQRQRQERMERAQMERRDGEKRRFSRDGQGRGGDSRGSARRSTPGGGYPNDRISGGVSHERRNGQSWRRDGYRTREERGGGRGNAQRPRHDFRKDDHKPRNFDRRRQSEDNSGE